MAMIAIEVYEWQPGAARPGAKTKARNSCVDILEVPSAGQIPNRGDVVLLNAEDRDDWPAPYRVIDREFLWAHSSIEDAAEAARWCKMWIHVRKLSDAEYAEEDSDAPVVGETQRG